MQGCLADISQETKDQMIALAQCSEAAGCDADADACLKDNCAHELQVCGVPTQ